MTVSGKTRHSISTPEQVDSRLGTLDFVDGKSMRLYNPLQPFFDKSWRSSEIEPVG